MTKNENDLEVKVDTESPQTNTQKPEKASKMQTRVRIIRFLLVSSFTGLLALGTFTLFTNVFEVTTLPHKWVIIIAEALSVTVSCVFSFFINSKFTFEDRKARRAGILLYILFYAIITPLGGFLILWLNEYIEWLIICKLVKMTINLVLDFAYCRFFLFAYLRKKYDVVAEAPKE